MKSLRVAVVAAALAVVFVPVGLYSVARGTQISGPSASVRARAEVNDPNRPEAHNTPSAAVDPRDGDVLIVANRLDAPAFGCALSRSTDGGRSWQGLALTPGLAAPDCFWPRVVFDSSGGLLVLYTPLGGPNVLPVGLWLQRYDASLRPEGPPVSLAGDLAFHARMAVVGEAVWVTWLQAGPATADNQLGISPGDNHIVVARSDDGGRTFGESVTVSRADQRVIQPTVLAWDGDRVLVGALDLDRDVQNYQATHDGQTSPDLSLRWRVVCWTSTDGGRTFGDSIVVGSDLPVPQLILADLGPTPGFARDPGSGRLYATWDAGSGNERDVFVARSDDDGQSWGVPTTVGPTGGSQHLPAVGVAPDGRVDVVYYDRGRDPDDVAAEAVVATSWDGGGTFAVIPVSEGLFDTRVGLGMQQGVPLLGDQLAVLSLDGRAVAFWADTVRGVPLVTNHQDLAVAVVEMDPGHGRQGGLILQGGALILGGLGLIAPLARRRRRAPENR